MPSKNTSRAVPELVGATEIAEMAGVANASVVTNWRRRVKGFPTPVQTLAMGPIYLKSDAQAFLDSHPQLLAGARRVTDETKAQIREAIANGEVNVSALARKFGCSRGSIYLAASDLLFSDEDATDPQHQPA